MATHCHTKTSPDMDQRLKGEGRSGALTNKTMHKIHQQQISENYAPVFQRVAPVNPRGIAQRNVSYNVRTPARVIHVNPLTLNKERSIRKHDRRERQREKKGRNAVVGDVMQNMRVFLCEVSVVGDINAVVSGGMRIDGRIKTSEPMSRKNGAGPNATNPINNRRNQFFSFLSP